MSALVSLLLSLSLQPLTAKAFPFPNSLSSSSYSANLLKSIQARGLPTGVPSCSTDSSYSSVQSAYYEKDGQGYYAGTDCNDGKGGGQCWTDYYLISAAHFYDGWTLTDSIDCGHTSTCENQKSSAVQICTQHSSEATEKVNAGIEIGLGEIASWLAPVDPKATTGGELGFTQGSSKTTCVTSTNAGTCTWNDQQCHAIWQAPMKSRVSGYMRRRCTTPRDGTNIPRDRQESLHTSSNDPHYTVGMQDFTFDQPSDTTLMGCSAFCNQTTYPDPAPGVSPEQYPWS